MLENLLVHIKIINKIFIVYDNDILEKRCNNFSTNIKSASINNPLLIYIKNHYDINLNGLNIIISLLNFCSYTY